MYIHLSINSNHPSIHLTLIHPSNSIHPSSQPSIHSWVHPSVHPLFIQLQSPIYLSNNPSIPRSNFLCFQNVSKVSVKQTVKYSQVLFKKKTNEEKHKARKRNYLFERKSDRYSRISIHTASIHERKYPALQGNLRVSLTWFLFFLYIQRQKKKFIHLIGVLYIYYI